MPVVNTGTGQMCKKGSTIRTLSETVLIQIVYLFFHVLCMSLVHVSTDLTYSRVPQDQGGAIFLRLMDFFRWSFYVQIGIIQFVYWIEICIRKCPNLCEIVCNKFVCNKFVLVLVQIDTY
jgi:hypothetical protein